MSNLVGDGKSLAFRLPNPFDEIVKRRISSYGALFRVESRTDGTLCVTRFRREDEPEMISLDIDAMMGAVAPLFEQKEQGALLDHDERRIQAGPVYAHRNTRRSSDYADVASGRQNLRPIPP
jgi:hypothetical protein